VVDQRPNTNILQHDELTPIFRPIDNAIIPPRDDNAIIPSFNELTPTLMPNTNILQQNEFTPTFRPDDNAIITPHDDNAIIPPFNELTPTFVPNAMIPRHNERAPNSFRPYDNAIITPHDDNAIIPPHDDLVFPQSNSSYQNEYLHYLRNNSPYLAGKEIPPPQDDYVDPSLGFTDFAEPTLLGAKEYSPASYAEVKRAPKRMDRLRNLNRKLENGDDISNRLRESFFCGEAAKVTLGGPDTIMTPRDSVFLIDLGRGSEQGGDLAHRVLGTPIPERKDARYDFGFRTPTREEMVQYVARRR